MKIERIQHVSLTRPFGSDEQVRAYYGDTLGLEEIKRPGSLSSMDLIWFRLGDQELHLVAEDAPYNTGSGRHLCLVVDDVPALRQKLEDRGHAIEDAVAIPNRPRFFSRDPFGNNIEFTTIVGVFE